MTSLGSLQSYNSQTQVAGPLFGDITTILVKSSISKMIFNSIGGISSKVNSLSKLGVTVQSSGQLSFDTSVFSSAMASDSTSVKNFFTQTTSGSQGLAVQFNTLLKGYTTGNTGIINSRINGLTQSSKDIDTSIQAITDRANTYQTTLQNQFNNLEQMEATMTSTQSYLTSQLSSLAAMTNQF
jgi:flagellar hook-associated protein 2